MSDLTVHRHGTAGPPVVVVHGGPGARGTMAPVARRLAARFRVFEPWQRDRDTAPLTVARHVADLHEVLADCCPGETPALVGESWGAMLVLAYGAARPTTVGPLVLIGCGTFDLEARAALNATIQERLSPAAKEAIARLEAEVADPHERQERYYRHITPVYDYDPDPPEPLPPGGLDVSGHLQTWEDMVRLQTDGVYPASFAAIRTPVLMLHGDYDPHPGARTRDRLQAVMPQLEYRELARCGHSPWRERQAREAFFEVLEAWLSDHLAS